VETICIGKFDRALLLPRDINLSGSGSVGQFHQQDLTAIQVIPGGHQQDTLTHLLSKWLSRRVGISSNVLWKLPLRAVAAHQEHDYQQHGYNAGPCPTWH